MQSLPSQAISNSHLNRDNGHNRLQLTKAPFHLNGT
jgi:hypothetical protein